MCRGGLVGYDAALTQLRSGVRFPSTVLLQKSDAMNFCKTPIVNPSWMRWQSKRRKQLKNNNNIIHNYFLSIVGNQKQKHAR
jgi:hypothetical protein